MSPTSYQIWGSSTGKAVVCNSWNLTGRLSSTEGASVSPEVQCCYFNGNVPCFRFYGPRLLLLRFSHKPNFKNYTPALINISGSALGSSPFRCALHSPIFDQINLRRLTNILTIDPHHPTAPVPHFPPVTRGGNLWLCQCFLQSDSELK